MADKHKYQKLELTWIGKGEDPKLEPRILVENPEYSYGDPDSGNMLIHGDNLLALKALEQDYTGKIKCIYIDPPYNTGNAFEHYDDGLEHSLWLQLIKQRIKLLRNCLADDGFLCCQIDDQEGAYLKVLLDEEFGRNNYLNTFYIQVRYGNKTLAEDNDFQKVIEQCFVYAKDKAKGKANKNKEDYSIDKFEWNIIELEEGEKLTLGKKEAELFHPGQYQIIKIPPSFEGLKETWATGSLIKQKASSGEFLHLNISPRKQIDGLGCLYKVYGIGEDGLGYRYFTGPKKAEATKGKFYSGIPLNRLTELKSGTAIKSKPIMNFYDLSANFGNCRQEGGVDFRGGKKPEMLIELILNYFSNPGDIVLDSFLGSGTTVAVAHKMNRKWIGIELGSHAFTHCYPRLKSVVNGEQTGISKSQEWQGGGGFKFYTLASSLLNQDKYGNWVISKEYDPQKLAAAMAKQEGFRYNPHETLYWKQGVSSEQDFIFTTTQFVTVESLDQIHDDMQPGESLLICCKSYQKGCKDKYKNISIKKIPQMFLGRCEFGRDDYSLNIVNMPVEDRMEDDSPHRDATSEKPVSTSKKKGKRSVQEINKDNQQLSLFD